MEIPAPFRERFESKKAVERAGYDLHCAKERLESFSKFPAANRVLAATIEEEWVKHLNHEALGRKLVADVAAAELALTVAVARARRVEARKP